MQPLDPSEVVRSVSVVKLYQRYKKRRPSPLLFDVFNSAVSFKYASSGKSTCCLAFPHSSLMASPAFQVACLQAALGPAFLFHFFSIFTFSVHIPPHPVPLVALHPIPTTRSHPEPQQDQ